MSAFEFYIEAFRELSTCRLGGMGLTPIPFSAILEYSRMVGLDQEDTDDLLYFIRKMDNMFITLENSKHGKPTTNKSNSSNNRQQNKR